jgi:processive 1,2-diacylglycerol beta-glucosyltransferase
MQPGGRVISTPSPPFRRFETPRRACTWQHWDVPTGRRQPRRPLLCELHAHSTWSDGELDLDRLVDLYGERGFDVLCVTDHVVRATDPTSRAVGVRNHAAYLDAIDGAAERALRDHGLLVIPGLELTYSDMDADIAVHALAVGLRRYVGVDDGPRAAMAEARAAGAAIIAAHPHGEERDPTPGRTTRGVYVDPQHMRDLVDRYELVNRHDVFAWVARDRLPSVACGDTHLAEHVLTWKTLLACDLSQDDVVRHLRSDAPAYLTRVDADAAAGAAMHAA